MSLRVCTSPGCPNLREGAGYCPDCARARDQARGSRHDRGYGKTHTDTRKAWAPRVAEGTVRCSRCRNFIEAGQPWHLDHDDDDRTKYRGPSHKRCNLSAGGRASHRA